MSTTPSVAIAEAALFVYFYKTIVTASWSQLTTIYALHAACCVSGECSVLKQYTPKSPPHARRRRCMQLSAQFAYGLSAAVVQKPSSSHRSCNSFPNGHKRAASSFPPAVWESERWHGVSSHLSIQHVYLASISCHPRTHQVGITNSFSCRLAPYSPFHSWSPGQCLAGRHLIVLLLSANHSAQRGNYFKRGCQNELVIRNLACLS